ncbi:MAG: hypothetical protein LBE89_01345 [Helicobacteraceae bacterium]|jgi:hypothetical protein|nr:hypothetical protein [Helicobacteraceae bacterium]
MAKGIIWKSGDLLNIRLRDGLFTIAQMLTSPIMRFYDISSNDGQWEHVDLNQVTPLCRVMVASRLINKYLVHEKIKNKTLIPSHMPFERYWIKTYSLLDKFYPGRNCKNSFPFMGGKLIDLGPNEDFSVTEAPIIKENLQLPQDREIIEKYELTPMWSHEDLGARLIRYFDTGINRDDLKFEVFPGLWDDREKLRPLTCRLPIPLR